MESMIKGEKKESGWEASGDSHIANGANTIFLPSYKSHFLLYFLLSPSLFNTFQIYIKAFITILNVDSKKKSS